MAVITAVTCPHCEKKFKPKTDVQGKKIKCPLCKEPFTVPAAKKDKGVKAGKPKAAKADPDAVPVVESAVVEGASPVNAGPTASDLDADENPYDVKSQDLTPRCPNCAGEMKSTKSVICLYCGYNTLTREIGKRKIVVALTFKRHLIYLLPAIGAAAFAFFAVVFLLYYAIVSPFHVHERSFLGGIFSFTDAESMRMWTTLIFLTWIWGAGMFCFKKFVEDPKPEEIEIES